jgi:hypothetical protein
VSLLEWKVRHQSYKAERNPYRSFRRSMAHRVEESCVCSSTNSGIPHFHIVSLARKKCAIHHLFSKFGSINWFMSKRMGELYTIGRSIAEFREPTA